MILQVFATPSKNDSLHKLHSIINYGNQIDTTAVRFTSALASLKYIKSNRPAHFAITTNTSEAHKNQTAVVQIDNKR